MVFELHRSRVIGKHREWEMTQACTRSQPVA